MLKMALLQNGVKDTTTFIKSLNVRGSLSSKRSRSLSDLEARVARANVLETARKSLLDFCRPFKFVVVSRPQDWL